MNESIDYWLSMLYNILYSSSVFLESELSSFDSRVIPFDGLVELVLHIMISNSIDSLLNNSLIISFYFGLFI